MSFRDPWRSTPAHDPLGVEWVLVAEKMTGEDTGNRVPDLVFAPLLASAGRATACLALRASWCGEPWRLAIRIGPPA